MMVVVDEENSQLSEEIMFELGRGLRVRAIGDPASHLEIGPSTQSRASVCALVAKATGLSKKRGTFNQTVEVVLL
jgi:hypothetical protein